MRNPRYSATMRIIKYAEAHTSPMGNVYAWELQGFYFTDSYPRIGTALVLVFSAAPVLRPIRPHRWSEYEKIWKGGDFS